MIKEEELASTFFNAFMDFKPKIEEALAVIANEFVNQRCGILVVKGYSRDFRLQQDPELEQAFNDEMLAYQESLQNMKAKIITLKSELEKITEKYHYISDIKNPKEKTKSLIDLFENIKHALQEIQVQLENAVMRKLFDSYNTIIVGGMNPNNTTKAEIEDIYSNTLKDITSGTKLVKEGIRLKNLFKKTLEEIKEKYFMDKVPEEEAIKTEEESEEGLEEIVEVLKDSVENVQEAEIDPSKPIVDGDIQLKTERSGIYVKIIPPENGGMAITLPELKSVIKGNKIELPPDDKLKNIVEGETDKYIKIAEWKPNPKFDAQIKVVFKENKTEAYFNVKAPRFAGKEADIKDFENTLNKNNIKYGVDMERIKRLVKTPYYNKEVLIAKGKLPIKGDNTQFKFNFKTKIERKPKVDKKGRVDHKKLNIIQNIQPNTLIAEKTPAKPGIPGVNVCNEEIPAQFGEDKTINITGGAEYRDNDTKIYSTIAGHPILRENDLTISPVYEVDGDVDYRTGNITFEGSIMVKGSVADEFEIKAKDDVEIEGNVYKAMINAGGNIVIHQGLNGREEGEVISGKSITAKYIENGKVKAKDEVIVTNNILHSHIKAGKSISCLGKGTVTGGNLIFRDYLECRVLGSTASTHTVVEMGVDDELARKQNQVAKEMYNAKKYIEKAKALTEKLAPKSESSNHVYARMLNVKAAGEKKVKQLNQMKNQLEDIAKEMFEVMKRSYVETNITYPNVEVRMNKLVKKTKHIVNYPHRINLVKKDIDFTPVERDEPQIETEV
jgi:hypothetical protein